MIKRPFLALAVSALVAVVGASSAASLAGNDRLGSRKRPVPPGVGFTIGRGWLLSVISVQPYATTRVLLWDRTNQPPKNGYQFFMARIRATYTRPGSAFFTASFSLRAVGRSGLGYNQADDSCGRIPFQIRDENISGGETIYGNVCWQVRSSDARKLLMYYEPGRTLRRTFFRLG
jgi:hypothetical protein